MLTAILIFAATLALVIWQPRGLGIGWSALLGAVVALETGVITLADVPVVWGIVWDATFTFIALIVISLILDAAGFFEWAALHVARWGRGYGHWLFLLIVLLTAAVAAIFANDGAVLILTPLVLEMLHALRLRPAAALAFVFAAGFMADAASLPLMISNLTNIIVANYFGISFADYAAVMAPVNVLAVLASLAVLWLFFRKDLPPRFEISALPDPAGAIRDPFVFKAGWLVLALLMAGYFAARPLGLPVSAVAGAAALLLVLAALREHFIRKQSNGRGGRMAVEDGCVCRHDRSLSPTSPPEGESDEVSLRDEPLKAVIPVMTLLREAPWQIVLFSLGMYLVVFGLRNQGFTAELGVVLEWLDGQGFWPATLGAGFLFAFLSAVMNNLPTVMVASLAIHDAHLSALTREAMIYANVIGCNLGPKMTPLGSLATLLWLHVLEQRGMRIGWGQYCRAGVALTVPVLLVTLLGLGGWLLISHG